MPRVPWVLVCIAVICSLSYADPPATTSAPSPTFLQQTISDCIRGLSSPDDQVREESELILTGMGQTAEPALVLESGGDTGPEKGAAIDRILAHVRAGLYSLDSSHTADIDAIKDPDATRRQTAIAALAAAGDPRVLVHLWEEQNDPQIKSAMLEAMENGYSDYAARLIMGGHVDDALELLRMCCRQGTREAARDLAFLAWDNDSLADEIKRAQAAVEQQQPVANELLAYCRFLNGELAEAKTLAAGLPDDALTQDIEFSQHNWDSFKAKAIDDAKRNDSSVNPAVGWMRFAHLSNDQASFDQAVEFATHFDQAHPGSGWGHSRAMIIAGRFEDGIELLKAEDAVDAMHLLLCTGQVEQAMALGDAPRPEDTDVKKLSDWTKLQIACTRELWFGGMYDDAKERMRNLLPTVLELEKQQNEALRCLNDYLRTECEIGQRSAAIDQVIQLESGGERLAYSPYIACVSNDAAGYTSFVWNAIRDAHPDLKGAIEFADRLNAGQLSAEEIEPLVRPMCQRAHGLRVLDGRDQNWAYQPINQLRLARAMLDRNHLDAQARDISRELIFILGDIDETARLAGAESAAGRNQSAAELWHIALELAPTAHNEFLYGQSIANTGDLNQATTIMNRGYRMQFGNDWNRTQFAELLDTHGQHEPAMKLVRLLYRAGRSSESGGAAMSLAEDAAANGKWAEAADLVDIGVSHCFGLLYYDDTYNVECQCERHDYLAHAALEAGRIDQACAEILSCEFRIDSDLDRAIGWISLLREHHREVEADKLLESLRQDMLAALRRFPDSSRVDNTLAWLDARCEVHLDEALEHAQAAVKISPKDANLVDTLAEVYYRRGDKPTAKRLFQQCVEMDPGNKVHRDRLREMFPAQ